MLELTKRQAAVLEFIESYYAQNGFSPTFEEIAAHFRFGSYNSVTDYAKVLKKKGYIDYNPGKSRSIIPKRILRKTEEEAQMVPLIGSIAAGAPITASENIEGYFDCSAMNLRGNEYRDKFALRVRGNSMIGRGIMDGDVVIVRKQPEVGARDVAAVRIGSEATLKYVRKDRNNLKLVPDNPGVKTIVVGPEDDVEVLGKVVRLFREEI